MLSVVSARAGTAATAAVIATAPIRAQDEAKDIKPSIAASVSSADAADVLDLAGVVLEALAQVGEQRRIGEDLGEVVGDLVIEDRLQPERRRHVAARRPGADARLLLLGHVPL